jgi:hypothetical protein
MASNAIKLFLFFDVRTTHRSPSSSRLADVGKKKKKTAGSLHNK